MLLYPLIFLLYSSSVLAGLASGYLPLLNYSRPHQTGIISKFESNITNPAKFQESILPEELSKFVKKQSGHQWLLDLFSLFTVYCLDSTKMHLSNVRPGCGLRWGSLKSCCSGQTRRLPEGAAAFEIPSHYQGSQGSFCGPVIGYWQIAMSYKSIQKSSPGCRATSRFWALLVLAS